MSRVISAVAGTAGVPVVRLSVFLRDLMHAMFGRYRPERHYMRGPGPAWQKKHPQER